MNGSLLARGKPSPVARVRHAFLGNTMSRWLRVFSRANLRSPNEADEPPFTGKLRRIA